MKLNKQDLNNYRRVINDALKDVEELHTIKLPNEMLDELFFGEVKTGGVKRFQYTFSAISALDLSDYSFENVSFNSDIPINLSNINAKIDFHKTHTYEMDRTFKLRNIDFSKTDLSEANLDGIKSIDNCDLSNTNIIWPKELFNATETDFTNTDMSAISVPLTALTKRYGTFDVQSFIDCVFTNTRLNLTVKNDLKLNYSYANFGNQVKEERNKTVNEMINNGSLLGCYINGKLIKTKEEYSKDAEVVKDEYKIFKSNKTNKALMLIKSQTTPSTGGKSIY